MKTKDVMVLRRSSSSCVETEVKRNGFWKFGKLFREEEGERLWEQSIGGFDEKSEMWVIDHMGVSRSRSLCSFRNGGWFGSENGGDLMVSGAKSSILGARSSSVIACMVLDSGRRSGFSKAEPRRSGFGFSNSKPRRSNFGLSDFEPRKNGFGFSDLETRRSGFGFSNSEQRKSSFGFSEWHGSVGFIDLKLDYYVESTPELSSEFAFGSMRKNSEYSRTKECGAFYGASFLFVLIPFTSI
ncbi:hypothetical protein UlMin_014363 [Ulmus minor]